MITANKDCLNNIFLQKARFEVPFFQRSYVWKEENWEILWEHIYSLFNKHKNELVNQEHFIGTLITKQKPAQKFGENSYELIDGQQRLTTFAILLKALSNSTKGQFPYLKAYINDLLRYKTPQNDIVIKIRHNKNDIKIFEEIIILDDNKLDSISNKEHRIYKAYEYFKKQVASFNDEDIELFMKLILNNISIINMLLSKDDDEQEIFDTINSLGERLTIGELLKNYIFMDDNLKCLFKEYWENIFEKNGEIISFWSKPKVSGRITRNNLEVFLYSFLIINSGKIILMEKLFNEYKEWLKDKSLDKKKSFLDQLSKYAEIYINFPSEIELNEICFDENEKRFFHIINNLEITTIYPLILFIYYKQKDNEKRAQILKILESYLVRRNICRLTSKNYNNLFISIINRIKENNCIAELDEHLISNILKEYNDETNVFPSNEKLESAFSHSVLSNKHAKEILYCIALSSLDTELHDKSKLSINSFSVEHIMPRAWETNWSNPYIDKEKRYKIIRTLGNLTIIKGKLNSKLQNYQWELKKEELKKYSSLELTTNYLDLDVWDESSISRRSKDLAHTAIKIWQDFGSNFLNTTNVYKPFIDPKPAPVQHSNPRSIPSLGPGDINFLITTNVSKPFTDPKPAPVLQSNPVPIPSLGSGDINFLNKIRNSKLKNDVKFAGEKLLKHIRTIFQGDLHFNANLNRYIESPDNFWTIEIQPNINCFKIIVYGKPENYFSMTLVFKLNFRVYSEFKFMDVKEIDEVVRIIQEAKKLKDNKKSIASLNF